MFNYKVIIVIGLLSSILFSDQQYDTMYISIDDAIIRKSPNMTSKALMSPPLETQIYGYSKGSKWFKVLKILSNPNGSDFPDEIDGYLHKSTIKNIPLLTASITVDVANVRETPHINSNILFKLPIGTRVSGYPKGNQWFEINRVSYKSYNSHKIKGYIHKSTIQESKGISKDKNEKQLQMYINKLERELFANPLDTIASNELINIYTKQKKQSHVKRIQSIQNGEIPIIISVPLYDNRVVVLGALYPNGKFIQYTFNNHMPKPEKRKLQMTAQRWWPISEAVEQSGANSDSPIIFPKTHYGHFSPDIQGDFIEWIELTPPTIGIQSFGRTRSETPIVLTSQPAQVHHSLPALSQKILNSDTIDKLYQWHSEGTCMDIKRPSPIELLRSLEVTRVPESDFLDIALSFNDAISRDEGKTRIIVDKKLNKKFIAKGSSGLWFTPKVWKNDIKISIAHHSSDNKACYTPAMDIGLYIILLMPDKSLKVHLITLGAWAC